MCSIDKFLNKKYKFVKSDEFYDDFLKEIGKTTSSDLLALKIYSIFCRF